MTKIEEIAPAQERLAVSVSEKRGDRTITIDNDGTVTIIDMAGLGSGVRLSADEIAWFLELRDRALRRFVTIERFIQEGKK